MGTCLNQLGMTVLMSTHNLFWTKNKKKFYNPLHSSFTFQGVYISWTCYPDKNQQFAYAKTKGQISFAVTAKLISTFVFAKQIVESLFYLYTKFQPSSIFLCLCSSICVGPVQKPHCRFSHEAAHILTIMTT